MKAEARLREPPRTASRRPDSNRRAISGPDYKSGAFNPSATSARQPLIAPRRFLLLEHSAGRQRILSSAKPLRPAAPPVQGAESIRQRVAVRTEQREIIGVVIFVIAVDVLDFDGYSAGFCVAFGPTASRASFTEAMDEISADKLVATVRRVRAALQLGCTQLKLPVMLTFERAILVLPAPQFFATLRAIAAASLKPEFGTRGRAVFCL